MSPLARVSDEQVGAVVLVTVDGEVDASNTRELGARLRDSLSNQAFALVVDLSAVGYIDSAGINLLFALGSELAQRRQELHLVVPRDAPIARMLTITGLVTAVAMHDARDEALRDAAAAAG